MFILLTAHYKSSVEDMRTRLRQSRTALAQVKASNMYRRLKRLEQKMLAREAAVQAHSSGLCERTKRDLQRKLKLAQNQASILRKKVNMQKK